MTSCGEEKQQTQESKYLEGLCNTVVKQAKDLASMGENYPPSLLSPRPSCIEPLPEPLRSALRTCYPRPARRYSALDMTQFRIGYIFAACHDTQRRNITVIKRYHCHLHDIQMDFCND